MNYHTCGTCLFGEDCGSSDLVYCWKKKTNLKANDPGCGAYLKRPPGTKPDPCDKCDSTGWVPVQTAEGEVMQRCVCLKRRIKKQKEEKKEKENGKHKIYS